MPRASATSASVMARKSPHKSTKPFVLPDAPVPDAATLKAIRKASRDDPKPKVGRPSSITDKVADELCARISGGEGILEISQSKDMPHEATIYRRMAVDEAFASRIARAREAQQDHEADVTVRLADKATMEDWQVIKLRIWARQWRAAKLAPKKYGEKQQIEHAGAIGVTIKAEELTDDELAAKIAGK